MLSLSHSFTPPPSIIRAARGADVERLARILADTFRHDPAHRWVFPDARRRFARGRRRFARLVELALRHGVVTTTSRLEGAALWMPSHAVLPVPDRMRNLLGDLLHWRAPLRLIALSRIQRTYPRRRHWRLTLLGTAPALQGTGVGSALLRPMLERCDREGSAAHLLCTNPASLDFYGRFGFAVSQRFTLPHGPPVWAMLRPPRSR
jgi:ribosomal protein S18 acetylase RimI-like enzyme